MKRFVNILLALLLCSTTLLAACDNGNQPVDTEPDSSTEQETEQPTEQETEAPTTEEITEIATEEDPTVPHQRFTEEELKTGIYDGYEVLVHTMNHPSLKNYDKRASQIKKEVGRDADNIEKLTGVRPVGMAWPGGDTEYTDTTIELVLENTDIRFARGTTSTYNFELPEYFMKWMPTCSAIDPQCLTLAQQFIDAECTEETTFVAVGC